MLKPGLRSAAPKGLIALATAIIPLVSNAETLRGEVFYLTRNALPASAQLRVSIIDASRADAKADVITYKEIATSGRQVPLPFTLDYQAHSLSAGHRYQVEAAIYDGGNLIYRNTTAIPLPDPSDTSLLRIQVQQIDRTGGAAVTPKPPVAEPGTTYFLTELLGKPFQSHAGTRRLYVNLDADKSQFSGFSGVNRFGGTYERDGYKIRFGAMRSSMMAGPAELMDLERDFQSIFGKATTAKVFGNVLVLYQNNQIIFKGSAQN